MTFIYFRYFSLCPCKLILHLSALTQHSPPRLQSTKTLDCIAINFHIRIYLSINFFPLCTSVLHRITTLCPDKNPLVQDGCVLVTKTSQCVHHLSRRSVRACAINDNPCTIIRY